MPQRPKSFYRPELDVLRFFAFLAVYGHHSLTLLPLANTPVGGAFAGSLGFGLCLFFTLSAYLITLLLLREKDSTGAIHLKQFYQRRILRIWPLYLGAVLGGALYAHHFGILHNHFSWYFAALVMCGNLVPFNGLIVGHLWSISIEEQFYVFWPTLMRHLSRRHMLIACAAIVLLANAVVIWHQATHRSSDLWTNTFLQFEMFAAGIAVAVLEDKRPVFGPALSALLLALVPVLWFFAIYTFHARENSGAVSVCMGYLLVALSGVLALIAVPGLHRWPKPMVYLGKISYGLYVFHVPVMWRMDVYWPQRWGLPLLLLLVLPATIAVSALSYRFFESPFLRLKRKLEFVHARPV